MWQCQAATEDTRLSSTTSWISACCHSSKPTTSRNAGPLLCQSCSLASTGFAAVQKQKCCAVWAVPSPQGSHNGLITYLCPIPSKLVAERCHCPDPLSLAFRNAWATQDPWPKGNQLHQCHQNDKQANQVNYLGCCLHWFLESPAVLHLSATSISMVFDPYQQQWRESTEEERKRRIQMRNIPCRFLMAVNCLLFLWFFITVLTMNT